MTLEKKLAQMSAIERIERLEAMAEKREKKKVPIPVEDSEKAELDHDIAETAIKISDLEDEKKEILAEFRDRIKEQKDDLKVMMEKHRTGQYVQDAMVYTINNEETQMVEEYTEQGLLIGSRRMPRLHQHSERRRLAEGDE